MFQARKQSSARRTLGYYASALAVAACLQIGTGGTAWAQTPDEDSSTQPADEAIVVTGSRVEREGFVAPTPTTVVTAAELQQGGRTNLGAALADLPMFRATSSPATNATLTDIGSAIPDLRGLGTRSTLVLVDRRRPVNTVGGSFSVNAIPFSLVKRIEVVTGGASAAWGSGAVAGVVNIILDTDLEGFKAQAQYGISSRGDAADYLAGIAYGSSFGGGRGHIGIAGEYEDSRGIHPRIARKNVGKWLLVNNPDFTPTNGQHEFLLLNNVNYNTSRGGLILSGPLANTQFGPGGVPLPYVRPGRALSPTTYQGEGIHNADVQPLIAPVTRKDAYAFVTYELTDNLRLRADGLYSRIESHSVTFPENDLRGISISVENAFLPESIRAELQARGQRSFLLGRFNQDFGLGTNDIRTETAQGTISLEGELAPHVSWDAYYSHGRVHAVSDLGHLRIRDLFAQSVDSVKSPTTGQPICRIALTVPGTACVPVNLFGYGSPSQQAIDFFTGTARADTVSTLDVAAATLRATPFSTWAGPVSIAAGGEWRREAMSTTPDPLSAQRRFMAINRAALSGEFSVKEAFAEAVVPLLSNLPLAQSLELNGAIRVSDYSTSGNITSWKVGVIHQPFDGLRLRATRSRDMRAPNISELFATGSLLLGTVTDRFKNNARVEVRQIGGGNPDLLPEKADTTTAGFILQPSWLRGFNLSVDYYSIKIREAIVSVASSPSFAQDVVDRCFAGLTAFCKFIERDAAGNIVAVYGSNQNLALYKTSGVDVEATYALPLSTLSGGLSGQLRFRGLLNYVDKLIIDDRASREDIVGNIGRNAGGVPHWRANFSVAYADRLTRADIRARYVGSGRYDSIDLADNHVGSRTYVDIGIERSLDASNPERVALFADVANLFDVDPPISPEPALFDLVGRYFSVGARVRF